jgi:hypothetical protein
MYGYVYGGLKTDNGFVEGYLFMGILTAHVY